MRAPTNMGLIVGIGAALSQARAAIEQSGDYTAVAPDVEIPADLVTYNERAAYVRGVTETRAAVLKAIGVQQ